MTNPEVALNLDESVGELLTLLTGSDLTYKPEYDKYRVVTKQLNRALRAMALEREWSYYSSIHSVGPAIEGEREYLIPGTKRPRIINDDSVRLVDEHDHALVWAYFLPRDALHKYAHKSGLWASVTRNKLEFSRPLYSGEAGLDIQLPVMREPIMFRLPPKPEDGLGDDPPDDVPDETRQQLIDFPYPDVVILRAAFYYAQTDPVMQPRVQTIEAQYKDLMYQIIEREERNTDSPYMNEFVLPIQAGLEGPGLLPHGHPHSNFGR